MKLRGTFSTMFDHILDCFFFLSAVGLAIVLLIMVYAVGMRYILDRPVIWALDIVGWSLVWIVFLGAAALVKKGEHVKVDVVLNYIKNPKTQIAVNVTTSIVAAVGCLVVAWYGILTTWDHLLRGLIQPGMVDAPKALLMVIIPVGSFLLFIQFLRRVYSFLGDWVTSRQV